MSMINQVYAIALRAPGRGTGVEGVDIDGGAWFNSQVTDAEARGRRIPAYCVSGSGDDDDEGRSPLDLQCSELAQGWKRLKGKT